MLEYTTNIMPSIKINAKADNPVEIRRALQQLNKETNDIVASDIPSSPSGNLSSTNVQDALEELDSEKAGIGENETITANWIFNNFPKFILSSESVTTNTTASKNITLVDCTSGNIQITLPDNGYIFVIEKIDSSTNYVTIIPTSGTIMLTTDVKIYRQGTSLKLYKVGTDWRII